MTATEIELSPHDRLLHATEPARHALAVHPLYKELSDERALRTFMGLHVWAVWDFMTLLGALRQAFTPAPIPWVPPPDRLAARAVNELVLAEETDEVGNSFASHFELYVDAMNEVDAPVRPVLTFVDCLRSGISVERSLEVSAAPIPARRFVLTTMKLAGSVPRAAGAFCYGRERLLPEVCAAIRLQVSAPQLAYYLDRHVELDGDEHTAAADAILAAACRRRDQWNAAEGGARVSLRARSQLWSDALDLVRAGG